MGKDVRKIVGAAAFAASFIPGLGTVIGISVGSLLRFGGMAMYPIARKKGKSERQEGVQFSVASTMRGLPIVYGKAKFGVSFADIKVDTGSTDNKDLWVVGAICHGGRRTGASGGINNILKVWFDDRLAVDDGVVQSAFSGKLAYYEHLGTDDQNVDAAINAVFPTAWPATSKGRQVTYIVMKLVYDRDFYPSDLPNIVVEVEGNQVYDPRDTNWKCSTNPALCIRDYLLSTVYGPGIAEADLVDSTFEAVANFCDEMVTVPDGAGGSTTQKRFECNGALDPNNSHESNLEELRTSCRGLLIFQGGKYRLQVPQSVTPETFELNESNVVGDVEYFTGGIDYAANIMRASYIDIDKDYRPDQVQFPEPGASNSYLTADNGFESIRNIELPMTTDEYMAQQICQVILNESRQDITCVVTAKEEALKLQTGTVVPVTLDTPGWSSKSFWVDGMFLGMDDLVRVVLREYDAAAYSYTTMSDKDTVPDTDLPDPFNVPDPTGLTPTSTVNEVLETNSGQIPRCKLSWTLAAHPFIAYTEVYAKLSSASEWDTFPPVPVDDDQEIYILVGAGEDWDFRIRCVNTIGKLSAYVSQVNQTMYDPDAYDPSQGDPPSDPSLIVLTATVETVNIEG